MLNAITGERLIVEAREDGGGTLLLPVSQVDQVTDLLNGFNIFNWVGAEGLDTAVVKFGCKVDARLVQYLLDTAELARKFLGLERIYEPSW